VRGQGSAWMERLYALVAALPRAQDPAELTAAGLPDLMATA
jgi:hypothetical protein